jgi:hypothetical protein
LFQVFGLFIDVFQSVIEVSGLFLALHTGQIKLVNRKSQHDRVKDDLIEKLDSLLQGETIVQGFECEVACHFQIPFVYVVLKSMVLISHHDEESPQTVGFYMVGCMVHFGIVY